MSNYQIKFYKYQGTGNDFIMIDNREEVFNTQNTNLIQKMCDRRFGIGGDGLILLQQHTTFDFEMLYFNADGSKGSMCGNGGRCIVAFAQFLGIIKQKTQFLAVDGVHEAFIKNGLVDLKMGKVTTVEEGRGFYYMDTGSPHYVQFVDKIANINIVAAGRKIRYSERFKAVGTNVNFVEIKNNGIEVATYERGVEDETLSCGTGVTAAAIAYFIEMKLDKKILLPIFTKGGNLSLRFEKKDNNFVNIWLIGKGEMTFTGEFNLKLINNLQK